MSREKNYSVPETLALLSQHRVQILSLSQIRTVNKVPKVLRTLEYTEPVGCLTVLPSGQVVSGSENGMLEV